MDWDWDDFWISMIVGVITVATLALYIALLLWLTPWLDSLNFSPWWILPIVGGIYFILSVLSAIMWDSDTIFGIIAVLTFIIAIPLIVVTIPVWVPIYFIYTRNQKRIREQQMRIGGKIVSSYVDEFQKKLKDPQKGADLPKYFDEKLWPVLGFLPSKELDQLFLAMVSSQKRWALEQTLMATRWTSIEMEYYDRVEKSLDQGANPVLQTSILDQSDFERVQFSSQSTLWTALADPNKIYTEIKRLQDLSSWNREYRRTVLDSFPLDSPYPAMITNICKVTSLLDVAPEICAASSVDQVLRYFSDTNFYVPNEWIEEIFPGWGEAINDARMSFGSYWMSENYTNLVLPGEMERCTTIIEIASQIFKNTQPYPYGEERYQTYKLLSTVYSMVFKRDLLTLTDQENHLFELPSDTFLYPKTVEVLRNFLQVSDLVYRSEQPGLMITEQLAYYAASLSILQSMFPLIDQEINGPDKWFLRRSADRWSDIIVKEIAKKRAKSDLVAKLVQPQLVGPYYLVEIILKNQAGGLAEKVGIQFDPKGELEAVGVRALNPRVDLKYIRGGQEIPIQFHLQIKQPGNFRLPFKIEFDDLERAREIIEFADEANFVDEEIDFKALTKNPYIAGPPIKSDVMFYGRSEVLSFVDEHLPAGDQFNIIVLHGERRTGKTSILYKLKRRLPEPFLPLFIDLQGAAGKSVERFWYYLASCVYEEMLTYDLSVEKPILDDFVNNEPDVYFHHEFLAKVKSMVPEKTLVLLIDEFDILEKSVREKVLPEGVLGNLRTLMQHSERLGFIFAGTYDITKMAADYLSVLFNTTMPKRINLLRWETFKSLVEDPVKNHFKYDELALRRIWDMTSGHPFFVQLICRELVIYCNQNRLVYITIQDVDNVIEDVIDQGEIHLGYMWDGLDREKKQFLVVISELLQQKGFAVVSDIRKSLTHYGISIDLEDANNELTAKAILVEKEGQYEFPIGLMRKWIHATKNLENLM